MNEELRRSFREGLPAWADTLEVAVNNLWKKGSEGISSIRRIAHSLRGSGGSYGYHEITRTSQAVEESPDGDIPDRSKQLIKVLRDLARNGDAAMVEILIVEDDPLQRQMLGRLLASPRRQVHVAATGNEALRIVEEHEVALILLDLMLPDIDGRNLISRWRDDPRTMGVPVFVLSGMSAALTKAECFLLGADDYFEKPIEPALLVTAVAAKLHRLRETNRKARQDALTGLANRVAFGEVFERVQTLTARSQTPLCLGVLDFDHFKFINDTYGHVTGDKVLRFSAEVIIRALRKSDIVARWGGEEFVVLLPNTDPHGAAIAMEKTLLALRNEAFRSSDGPTIQATFSAGVAAVPQAASLEDVVSQADHYLYLAKMSGRNRVCWQDEQGAPPRARIMLVDDDPSIVHLIEQTFDQADFEVLSFPDAETAIAAAEQTSVSLVIIDVRLPGMDGFELLGRLRQFHLYRQVPMLMLTVMGREEDVVRGFELGADDYVLKPFAPTELLARARRLLRRR